MRAGGGGDGAVGADLCLFPLHHFFIKGFGLQIGVDCAKSLKAKLR